MPFAGFCRDKWSGKSVVRHQKVATIDTFCVHPKLEWAASVVMIDEVIDDAGQLVIPDVTFGAYLTNKTTSLMGVSACLHTHVHENKRQIWFTSSTAFVMLIRRWFPKTIRTLIGCSSAKFRTKTSRKL